MDLRSPGRAAISGRRLPDGSQGAVVVFLRARPRARHNGCVWVRAEQALHALRRWLARRRPGLALLQAFQRGCVRLDRSQLLKQLLKLCVLAAAALVEVRFEHPLLPQVALPRVGRRSRPSATCRPRRPRRGDGRPRPTASGCGRRAARRAARPRLRAARIARFSLKPKAAWQVSMVNPSRRPYRSFMRLAGCAKSTLPSAPSSSTIFSWQTVVFPVPWRPRASQSLCLSASATAFQGPGHGRVQQALELPLLTVVDDPRTARRRCGRRASNLGRRHRADQPLVRRDHGLDAFGGSAAVAFRLELLVKLSLVPQLAVEQGHGQKAVLPRDLGKLRFIHKVAQPSERPEEYEALAVVAVTESRQQPQRSHLAADICGQRPPMSPLARPARRGASSARRRFARLVLRRKSRRLIWPRAQAAFS